MKGPPVLEIRNVTVARDGQTLVSDVSLSVAPGTIHVLLGPNGAGKSTLFSAILGAVDFSGEILFHWRASGRLGYVPQFFTVDRTLPVTVAEFLALSRQRWPICLGVGHAARRRAGELLARVGLEGFETRPLGALSGGELRRVLFAHALDPVPELLLLDEPGTGLDARSVARLEETLLELRANAGTAVLMVSHDVDHARRIADRATVLDKRIQRSGQAADVLGGEIEVVLPVGNALVTS